RYHAVIGALVGLLYWKRGLVCWMAAHAAFNGVLLVVAAVLAFGPTHGITGAGLTLRAPGSWHGHTGDAESLEVVGPSGAHLLVRRVPSGRQGVDADGIATQLNAGTSPTPDVVVDGSTARVEEPPVGRIARAD